MNFRCMKGVDLIGTYSLVFLYTDKQQVISDLYIEQLNNFDRIICRYTLSFSIFFFNDKLYGIGM